MDGLGIDHHLHHQHHHHNHAPFSPQQLPSHPPRKRKAETLPENNERLSKRMSLLNLEQSGQKLYVPVENPNSQLSDSTPRTHHHHKTKHGPDPSQMELDDSKYKVYIYNLDDELSSSDNENDTESDNDGKLVFLPDIEKHLRNNRRIPAHVLGGPRPPGPAEWAAGKELVLYREPSSLSVPEERDSVRKAILEARARAREKQRAEQEQAAAAAAAASPTVVVPVPAMTSSVSLGDVPMDADPLLPGLGEEDPDAMELD